MVSKKGLPNHRSSMENVPPGIPLRPRVRYFFRGCAAGDRVDPGGKGNIHLVDTGLSDFIYW